MGELSVALWCSSRQAPLLHTGHSELLVTLRQIVRHEVRTIIRDELREERHLRSFAAQAGLLCIDEAGEYLRISRAKLSELRHARKVAKTEADKDAAFAPEYGTGRNTKFKRAELDAWLNRQRR